MRKNVNDYIKDYVLKHGYVVNGDQSISFTRHCNSYTKLDKKKLNIVEKKIRLSSISGLNEIMTVVEIRGDINCDCGKIRKRAIQINNDIKTVLSKIGKENKGEIFKASTFSIDKITGKDNYRY